MITSYCISSQKHETKHLLSINTAPVHSRFTFLTSNEHLLNSSKLKHSESKIIKARNLYYHDRLKLFVFAAETIRIVRITSQTFLAVLSNQKIP